MKRLFLGYTILILLIVPKNVRACDLQLFIETNDSLYNLSPKESEMKIRDLIMLVKYAQGAVAFDNYFEILNFLKPPERKVFMNQIVELIEHFTLNDSLVDLSIKRSELESNSPACLILRGGFSTLQLQKIVALPENELRSSFKLLLTLFSIGYEEGFQRHKNAPDKFWYWDYTDVENILKTIDMEIDYNKYVQLNEILKP